MNIEQVPLGQLLKRSPRYGINAPAVTLKPGIPTYVRITDIDEFGRFSQGKKVGVKHPDAANYKLADGDIVFARTGASVGKSYLYDPRDGELVYAGFLINFTPDPERLNPKYLALYVQTKDYWDWVARTSVRSGQPGVNSREFARLIVPLPGLHHQRAIAEVFSDVDDLIATLERLIAKKQAVKQGMMQQLLTGRTRLPGFEEEWTEETLGSIAEVRMGQSPTGSSYNTSGLGLPLVQGKADIHGRTTVDRTWTWAPTKVCEAGDVLLTVRAPVGFTAIASKRSSLGRGVCGINAGADNQFLFYALVHREPLWALYEQGSTFTAINSNEVKSFIVHWPTSIEERQEITQILNDVDKEISLLSARLDKARAVKVGMMQQLLTGRIRLPVEDSV